jgi:SNF2 family DNA or RNA helicase
MLKEVDEAEGIQRRGMVLAALSRLKQVCNHPAHFLHDGSALPGRSGKLERLVEMLEEVLSVGEAALIFTQFAEMGELLRAHLQASLGREALFLHGAVPRKQRDVMVERFQATGGPPLMIAFRIGQTRNVQVHKFLCAGTLEDHIDALIEQKQELAQSIVGSGEQWLTELSTAQLRDLVTLRRDAVAAEG